MWLLPLFHKVSSLALGLYYRTSVSGGGVPRDGPVLLLANHPNSLLDPAFVSLAARRPVRFLAKSTLFSDRAVGWLVRGAGAIPVYRRQDDPTQMRQNLAMFQTVQNVLAAGAAVGLFPEGLSHSEPSLATLRTGGARIALGAAVILGRPFPIIPVGLTFRRKATFRSGAHVEVGVPVQWDDLAPRGEDDAGAVRELTERIDQALRGVTVNLEHWEDAPLVELAEAVYTAEFGLSRDAGGRIARMGEIARTLAAVRSGEEGDWKRVADELRVHGRLLRWFHLKPHHLHLEPRLGTALWWSLKRLPLAVAALSGIWLVGGVLFWVPYTITDKLGERAGRKGLDLVATTKMLGGAATFLGWILLLALAMYMWRGTVPGLAVLAALPVLAVATLLLREKLSDALRDALLFLRVSRNSGMLRELRARQHVLAERLDLLWRSVQRAAGTSAVP